MGKKKNIKKQDYHFSTKWIDNNEAIRSNPINTILFSKLMEQLQEQVDNHEKKPIFNKDEDIRLKPSTIRW